MITYNKISYATSDNELIDSLFESNGTLTPLHKIERCKTDVKYFIDENHGFGINVYGVGFKFNRLSNNKLFYQISLDFDEDSLTQNFEKEFKNEQI